MSMDTKVFRDIFISIFTDFLSQQSQQEQLFYFFYFLNLNYIVVIQLKANKKGQRAFS